MQKNRLSKITIYGSIITFLLSGCCVTKMISDSNNVEPVEIYSIDIEDDNGSIEDNSVVSESKPVQTDEIIKKESELIDEMNTIETDISNTIEDNISNGLAVTKEKFILLVDFVFYDGKINDITFSELSEAGKEKVLQTITNIDNVVINYYPNYKEDILNLTEESANTFMNTINEGKDNVENFAKENVSENTLNNIKDYSEKFNNTIDSIMENEKVNDTYNTVKEKGTEVFDYAKEKGNQAVDALDDWYQNFKR